jgi:heat shock protein HslJ
MIIPIESRRHMMRRNAGFFPGSRITRVLPLLALLLTFALATGCGDDDDDDDEDEGSTNVESLEGVPWVLSSGVDVDGWEETGPSAAFENGNVSGSSGCNQFSAEYTLDGDSLELGAIASTLMACPPPADQVESAYLALLEQVRGWRLDDDALVLFDDEGVELLRYRAASVVGDWELTSYQTGTALQSPIAGTTITASFAEDGNLNGSGGCNTYNATYTTEGGRITISEPVSTLIACLDPEGVMDQESAYLASLASVEKFRIDGGSLSLLRADGTIVASYVPATSP